MNYLLVLFGIWISILNNYCINCDIKSDIVNYYNSETVNSFKKQWETSRKAYENALKIALKDSFGAKSLNTIERKLYNGQKISKGFYLNDNIVHMFFQDIFLKELPHVRDPDIYFPLGDNVLKLQTQLSKMILETKYSLMRNDTVLISAGLSQNDHKTSPFAHQEVQSIAQLAIITEDCSLSGFAIARLSGESVILGHDTFRINNCKFTVEISAETLGTPPVIAPYFSKQQRALLENLITKPLRKELMGKLQAAIFTYVNTSIFRDDLLKYRNVQEKIFQQTSIFLNTVIQNSNKIKTKENNGAYDLLPLDIAWAEKHDENSVQKSMKLKNIVAEGFDSTYSPKVGGPYKMQEIGIVEKLKYATLKVRGKIVFVQDATSKEFDFLMDLLDVTVNIYMKLGQKSQGFCVDTLVFWRDTDFSITKTNNIKERVIAESLISGYLINEVPKFISKKHMKLTCIENTVKQRQKTEKENVDNESLQNDRNDELANSVEETGLSASIENPVGNDNSEERLNKSKEVVHDDNSNNSEVSEGKPSEETIKNDEVYDDSTLKDSSEPKYPEQSGKSKDEGNDLSSNNYNKDFKESEGKDQSLDESRTLSELETHSKEEFHENKDDRLNMETSVPGGEPLDDSTQINKYQLDHVKNDDGAEIAQRMKEDRRKYKRPSKKHNKYRNLNLRKHKMGMIKN